MSGYFARITPISGVPGAPDIGLPEPPPGVGGGPIIPPPLPGVWPKPGEPTHPIEIPPVGVMPPIFIPEDPQHPIQLPPGVIWPPLPPDVGLPSGKVAILIWVVGVGHRWFIYESPTVWPPTPPTAGPK